ncbi:hypothetical protein AOXY_G5868 [Acipenser oxyrinchus oxyrinchus]|uniref:Myb/SANT-like DNA-binding domain-containing protein n=1 Tax=Acipenser oxyrinchus oxyrinchus TaxID=40147 RepID=A0AAD8LQG4_ACIOX|nr:hypothetical protein AOXY_G5868 [Acipenser oxyrinchus oxyrinchus]
MLNAVLLSVYIFTHAAHRHTLKMNTATQNATGGSSSGTPGTSSASRRWQEGPTRKRKQRFSDADLDHLLEEVDRNRATLFGTPETPTTPLESSRTWAKIARNISAVGKIPRDGTSCRKRWNDARRQVKKRMADLTRVTWRTVDTLTPWEMKVASLIPTEEVEGLGVLEAGFQTPESSEDVKGWAQEAQELPSDEDEANTFHHRGPASYMTVCEDGRAVPQERMMSAGREQGDEPEAASMWDEKSARRDSSPEDTPSSRRHRITPGWRQAGISIGSLEARGSSSFRRRSTDEQLIRMEERILASQWQANTEMRGVMELILLEFRELNSILRQRLPPAPSPSGESSIVVDSSSQTE